MRGDNSDPEAMSSYMRPAEQVPQDHRLRAIKAMTDRARQALSSESDRLYSRVGRTIDSARRTAACIPDLSNTPFGADSRVRPACGK
jgi:hypothetical protein